MTTTSRDRVRRFIMELMDESVAVGDLRRIIASVRFSSGSTLTHQTGAYETLADELTNALYDEPSLKEDDDDRDWGASCPADLLEPCRPSMDDPFVCAGCGRTAPHRLGPDADYSPPGPLGNPGLRKSREDQNREIADLLNTPEIPLCHAAAKDA